MGQKRDLTDSEKSKIVKSISEGCSTLEIAEILGRDHRTIKRFVANSQQGRKNHVEKKICKLTAKYLRRIKHEATRNPLSSSAVIFQNCNLPGVPRSTRCSVLRDMAKVRKAETRGWISNGTGAPLRLRRQQGGGGVLVWAGIIKDELVEPFRVEDGLKLNSQTYCQFLEDTFFKQWYRKKSASFKKTMIFMRDNAPSHALKYFTAWLASKGLKDERIMTWPPSSPDLNPIDNLWSLLTVKENSTPL